MFKSIFGKFSSKIGPEETVKPLPERRQLHHSLTDFDLGNTIGVGKFGRIRHAIRKSDQFPFAIKCINKSNCIRTNQMTHLKSEVQVLSRIDHIFIVKMYSCFADENIIYLVLSLAEGGDLFNMIRYKSKYGCSIDSTSSTKIKTASFLNNAQTRFIASEVICALDHIHSYQILYRDLKPENVLITAAGHVLLTDFGFCKLISSSSSSSSSEDNKTHTMCGTPEYIAPEMLACNGYSFEVDFWQLGVLLYECFAGNSPFSSSLSVFSMYNKIMHEKLIIPSCISSQSRSAAHFISSLLAKQPLLRLTRARGHPWFAGVSWNVVEDGQQRPPLTPTPEVDYYQSFGTMEGFSENMANLTAIEREGFDSMIDGSIEL